jgi:Holliday junction resolvase RusA-like endonuclease
MSVQLIIPGVPHGKARPKVTTINGIARAYTPSKTVEYENLVKLAWGRQPPLDGAIVADIVAYYAIPASWSKRKTDQALCGAIVPQTKPDADNISKVILDALNHIAYKDDSQVVDLRVRKVYSLTPCVQVNFSKL